MKKPTGEDRCRHCLEVVEYRDVSLLEINQRPAEWIPYDPDGKPHRCRRDPEQNNSH